MFVLVREEYVLFNGATNRYLMFYNSISISLSLSPPPPPSAIATVGFLSPRAGTCLLYTSPSPRDRQKSRMPSSAWKKIRPIFFTSEIVSVHHCKLGWVLKWNGCFQIRKDKTGSSGLKHAMLASLLLNLATIRSGGEEEEYKLLFSLASWPMLCTLKRQYR